MDRLEGEDIEEGFDFRTHLHNKELLLEEIKLSMKKILSKNDYEKLEKQLVENREYGENDKVT